MSVEVPDFMRRAMEAHGVDPEEVARQTEHVDLEVDPEPEIAAVLFDSCPACHDRGQFYDPELGRDVPCSSCQTKLVPGETRDAESAALLADVRMAQARGAERVQLWKEAARRWVRGLVPGQEFTADDLVAALGLPDPDAGPSSNNVVGAMFSAWSKAGLIVFSGRYRASERVIRHGNPDRVWIAR